MTPDDAFLHAIRETPEDDAPRLVYADWLEDNGQPTRAEYIRVACALFDRSPADADFADLDDRKRDVLAALRRHRLPEVVLPDGVAFADNWSTEGPGAGLAYQRGFPYFAHQLFVEGGTPPENEVRHAQRLRDALPAMIETTTLRGLQLHDWSSRCVGEVLNTPAAECLSALNFFNYPWKRGRNVHPLQAVVSSPASDSLRWLGTDDIVTETDVERLAGVNLLPRMHRLEVDRLRCPSTALRRLTEAPWFGRLRRVECELTVENARDAVLALAKLPELHTLRLYKFPAEGLAAFAQAGAFKVLGGLSFRAKLRGQAAEALSRAVLPRLASLSLDSCRLQTEDVTVLSQSGLFANLRMLSLWDNVIGDRGFAAIAASPCAAELRVLSMGNNRFGKQGLKAIARPGALPNLTTLDMHSHIKFKASTADLTRFLTEVRLPRLRSLNLGGLPLCDSGAEAIAANPAFSNLTCLDLNHCRIGEKGGAALLASPHLQGLININLVGNQMYGCLEALLDRGVLPRLSEGLLPADVQYLIRRIAAAREGFFPDYSSY